jgi:ribosomal protein S18 acetylase RimI-like enzyme
LDLLERHRQRGVHSFLHVSEGNVGARRLYDAMGFAVRAHLELGLVERQAAR